MIKYKNVDLRCSFGCAFFHIKKSTYGRNNVGPTEGALVKTAYREKGKRYEKRILRSY